MPLFPSSRRYSRTQSMYVGLEEQNERLRVQNLRCAAQLKVLKSCADRSKHWQQSLLFSHSVTDRQLYFEPWE
ncbi:hypothetical protein AB6A40_002278 [Gnathostoma spinigerum]|uniref:Uncharacterized protein n=1 Tax=Gnathostoma spinigerum TaxID=75299 RepID=A0ABD6E667_9BILA